MPNWTEEEKARWNEFWQKEYGESLPGYAEQRLSRGVHPHGGRWRHITAEDPETGKQIIAPPEWVFPEYMAPVAPPSEEPYGPPPVPQEYQLPSAAQEFADWAYGLKEQMQPVPPMTPEPPREAEGRFDEQPYTPMPPGWEEYMRGLPTPEPYTPMPPGWEDFMAGLGERPPEERAPIPPLGAGAKYIERYMEEAERRQPYTPMAPEMPQFLEDLGEAFRGREPTAPPGMPYAGLAPSPQEAYVPPMPYGEMAPGLPREYDPVAAARNLESLQKMQEAWSTAYRNIPLMHKTGGAIKTGVTGLMQPGYWAERVLFGEIPLRTLMPTGDIAKIEPKWAKNPKRQAEYGLGNLLQGLEADQSAREKVIHSVSRIVGPEYQFPAAEEIAALVAEEPDISLHDPRITEILKKHENPLLEMAVNVLWDPVNVAGVGFAKLNQSRQAQGVMTQFATKYTDDMAGLFEKYPKFKEIWNSSLNPFALTRRSKAARDSVNAYDLVNNAIVGAEHGDDVWPLVMQWADDPAMLPKSLGVSPQSPAGLRTKALLEGVGVAGMKSLQDPDAFKLVDFLVELDSELSKSANAYHAIEMDKLPGGLEKWNTWMGSLKNYISDPYLGMNPGYVMRNAYNNFVTTAIDGVQSFDRAEDVAKFFDRIGLQLSRSTEGIGSADLARRGTENVPAILKPVRKLGNVGHGIATGQNFLIGEGWYRVRANKVGAQRFFGTYWRYGGGPFDRWFGPGGLIPEIPPEIGGQLSPEALETLQRGLEQGRNKDEFLQAIFRVTDEELGISVSKYLEHPEDVSPELLSRVQNIVDNYNPETFADEIGKFIDDVGQFGEDAWTKEGFVRSPDGGWANDPGPFSPQDTPHMYHHRVGELANKVGMHEEGLHYTRRIRKISRELGLPEEVGRWGDLPAEGKRLYWNALIDDAARKKIRLPGYLHEIEGTEAERVAAAMRRIEGAPIPEERVAEAVGARDFFAWQEANVEQLPKQMTNRIVGHSAEGAGDVFREFAKWEGGAKYPGTIADASYIEQKLGRIERDLSAIVGMDDVARDELEEIAKLFEGIEVPEYLEPAKRLNIALASGDEVAITGAIDDVRATLGNVEIARANFLGATPDPSLQDLVREAQRAESPEALAQSRLVGERPLGPFRREDLIFQKARVDKANRLADKALAEGPEQAEKAIRKANLEAIRSVGFESWEEFWQSAQRVAPTAEAVAPEVAEAARPAVQAMPSPPPSAAGPATDGRLLSYGDAVQSSTEKELEFLERVLAGVPGEVGNPGNPGLRTLLMGYLDDTLMPAWSDTRIAGLKYGEGLADFALLNYNLRRNLDTWLGLVTPYHYWYTRTAKNWATRAATKPGAVTSFLRYDNMMQKMNKELPARLRRSLTVPMPEAIQEKAPFVGEELYIDPTRALWPMINVWPWSDLQGYKWGQDNEEDRGMLGQVYNMQRNMQMRPYFFFDLAQYAVGMKDPKDMYYFLPQTAAAKGTSALLREFFPQVFEDTIPPGGWNIEAGVREKLGLPRASWADEPYWTYQAIQEMAADGEITAQEGIEALHDAVVNGNEENPIYLRARQRAGVRKGIPQVTSFFLGQPVNIYPTGERMKRETGVEVREAGYQYPGQLEGTKEARTAIYERDPWYGLAYPAREAALGEIAPLKHAYRYDQYDTGRQAIDDIYLPVKQKLLKQAIGPGIYAYEVVDDMQGDVLRGLSEQYPGLFKPRSIYGASPEEAVAEHERRILEKLGEAYYSITPEGFVGPEGNIDWDAFYTTRDEFRANPPLEAVKGPEIWPYAGAMEPTVEVTPDMFEQYLVRNDTPEEALVRLLIEQVFRPTADIVYNPEATQREKGKATKAADNPNRDMLIEVAQQLHPDWGDEELATMQKHKLPRFEQWQRANDNPKQAMFEALQHFYYALPQPERKSTYDQEFGTRLGVPENYAGDEWREFTLAENRWKKPDLVTEEQIATWLRHMGIAASLAKGEGIPVPGEELPPFLKELKGYMEARREGPEMMGPPPEEEVVPRPRPVTGEPVEGPMAEGAVPYSEEIGAAFEEYPDVITAIEEAGYDPARFIAAIIQVESGGRPDAINEASEAAGLMQVMPYTSTVPSEDLLVPEVGISQGVRDLYNKLANNEGDLYEAMFDYSGGPRQEFQGQMVGWESKEDFEARYWQPLMAAYESEGFQHIEPELAGRLDRQAEQWAGLRDPDMEALSEQYFALPEKSQERRDFVAEHPELPPYWEKRREYKRTHPEFAQYYFPDFEAEEPAPRRGTGPQWPWYWSRGPKSAWQDWYTREHGTEFGQGLPGWMEHRLSRGWQPFGGGPRETFYPPSGPSPYGMPAPREEGARVGAPFHELVGEGLMGSLMDYWAGEADLYPEDIKFLEYLYKTYGQDAKSFQQWLESLRRQYYDNRQRAMARRQPGW